MYRSGLRFITSVAMAGVEVAVDAGRAVGLEDLFDIRPRQFRRLLLTFEETIQGNIPAILGDDEEERIDTMVRLLRGTSEKDLTQLIGALQEALNRLEAEKRRDERRHRRDDREDERRADELDRRRQAHDRHRVRREYDRPGLEGRSRLV
ncbi:MAG TPA: hypothetical protein VHL53_19650 [Acidimicrobiia bacterium]|nr:hypothetical protein [Acidimicrobiia bacterium]